MAASFLERVNELNVWRRGDERAPHKPLLLLLAFGRLQRDEARLVRFADIEAPLTELPVAFGPPRKPTPHNPYWYLQNDGLWVFEGSTYGLAGPSKTPRQGALRDSDTHAGLPVADVELLLLEPALLETAARGLLARHFPESLHEDILQAVGLSFDALTGAGRRRRRDPKFRPAVLNAYKHCCAVCGLQILVGGSVGGVEAAHVKWHAANGPDEVSNGLALCALHHKALDRGWLGIDETHHLRVGDTVSGSNAFEQLVGRFDEQPLREPRRPDQRVSQEHREWHWREVFRGVAA